ncbi:EAL domain-containing protein [Kosakonia sp. BYX6]|uniref:cyclic-guanylate-specific phosphodiesterase n=1 Tax=Kosakonia calanthes TaxID=3139408 RepID=A0ABZ3B246_9ENTR
MTNRRLVSLITAVLALAVFLPVGLSIWMTHRQAEETFMNDLDTYASLAEMRTQRVVDQSKDALRELDTWRGTPCTPDHLLTMRRISYSWRYVREVFYINDRQPLCSSLAADSRIPPFPSPEKTTADGFRAWLTRHNDLGLSQYMIAIGSKHHVVMIDPRSFIDVLSYSSPPKNVALISTKTHQLIAGSSELTPQMLAQITQTGPTKVVTDRSAYVIQRDTDMGLAIVTWMPVEPLEKNWHHLLMIWLPIGLLMSVLIALVLLRVLHRLQSPRAQLQDAIHSREITVFYQPIVALGNGRMVGAEALARWQQKDGSWLAPDSFIPLAQHSGLIPQLTHLVVETVFETLGPWLQRHPEHHISINLEPSDLLNPALPALLARLLELWQLSPSQIALEITERGFADPAVSGPAIATLREAGHAIYIDDFGTGYCSLSYLQNLDVDIIKIDKSFVDALEFKTVTPHIIEMAKALRLAMVAEGIETEGQLQWLTRYGVEYGQGWLYSKALPAEEFVRWAENNLRGA